MCNKGVHLLVIRISVLSKCTVQQWKFAQRFKIRRFEIILLPYSALALIEVRQGYRTGLRTFSYSLDIGPLSSKEKLTVL